MRHARQGTTETQSIWLISLLRAELLGVTRSRSQDN